MARLWRSGSLSAASRGRGWRGTSTSSCPSMYVQLLIAELYHGQCFMQKEGCPGSSPFLEDLSLPNECLTKLRFLIKFEISVLFKTRYILLYNDDMLCLG